MYEDNYNFLNELLIEVTSLLHPNKDVSKYNNQQTKLNSDTTKNIFDAGDDNYLPDKNYDVYITFNDDLYYLTSVDNEYKITLNENNTSVLFFSEDLKKYFKIILIKRNE